MEITASRRLFSTISLRMDLCAFDEPKRTPSGTIEAHLPPTLRDFRNNERKRSSVFFVDVSVSRSFEIVSLSREPVNGGFAIISEYSSLWVLSSERESCQLMFGASTPWSIIFIAPIRSIVWSVSKPENIVVV